MPDPGWPIGPNHALTKAHLLGITRSDVEDAILGEHGRRSRNAGAADWLVVARRVAIAYNYPADEELTRLPAL